jgi:heptosyltransferase-2
MDTADSTEREPLILVIGPSWVGDMMMAQSLFKALRLRQPVPRIHVLAPAWTRPLLERMPEVEHSIDMPLGHGRLALRQRRRLGRSLREAGYTQAIVLPNSWKSALTPFWARIPVRTGWRGEMRYGLLNDVRKLDKKQLPTTVQRFVALGASDAEHIPTPKLDIKAFSVQKALQQLGLRKSARRRVLALCPGAEFGDSKRWPAAYYGKLAKLWTARGWDVWLFGSANDRVVCADVNGFSGGQCSDLSGRTSLAQAVDLLSLADLVVTNDSGLMHVAAALGHPLVALFGSTDPQHTPPLSQRAKSISLHLPCSPCFARDCPLGHSHCMMRLPLQRVTAAMEQLLA